MELGWKRSVPGWRSGVDLGCLGGGRRPARVPAIGSDDTLPPLVILSL